MKTTRMLALAIGAAIALSASPASAQVQGVSDGEILLGSHQDLSGPINFYGVPMKNGLEMAADEINAAGGIHGRMIRVIVEDSAYDPKKAVLGTQKLLGRDKIFAMIASLGTPTSAATMPLVLKKGLPHLFPMSPADMFFTPHDPLKFGFFTPYYQSMRVGVNHLIGKNGYTKVGILYQDDGYGENVKKGVVDQLEAMGMELVSETTYKRGATDFATQIAKLRSDGVDFVTLGTVIRETVGAVKTARAMGWDVDFLVSGAGYAQTVAALGGEAMDGLYGVGQTEIPYRDTASPEVQAWMDRYEERFGKPASIEAAYTYGAMYLFAEGAKNAGRDLTPESLVAGLEMIDGYQDIFGSPAVTFTAESHLPRTEAIIAQVEGGRWHTLTDILTY
jgi:branched-chain amino acid transport system substrate-binding protein